MSEVEHKTSSEDLIDVSVDGSGNFYLAALARLRRFMLFVGLSLVVAAKVTFGLATATGLFLGCTVACLNILWTERAVNALGKPSQRRTSQAGTIFRFVARYVLMAAVSYAILSSYPASFSGLIAGLFLPVVAIACEAGHSVLGLLFERHHPQN
jgi:hypothetical protein